MTTISTTLDGRTVEYRDEKRRLWLLGLLVPLLPFAAAGAAHLWGDAGWWLGPMFILVVVPILDTIFGTDRTNPPEWAVEQLSADRFYRWCTFLFIPLQYAGLVFACWTVATDATLSTLDMIGFALTVGTVAGVAINTAHELGHKAERSERRLARVALAQSGYGHFVVEHNRGHHLRVATPEDPASSRLGQSFWAFLPRSVLGGLRSAWHLEAKRLAAHDKAVFGPGNDVIVSLATTLVLFAALSALFGWTVLGFLAIQAIFGFSLLEVVNYVEHYGLLRQRNERGRYERCRPEHSWNANHIASNVVLYQLERHSDHHAHPTRRYQALRHFDESPQLPSGYGLMVGLAALPPVWRRVMDHRVIAHYGGDITRANIHPAARERVLARYHGSVSLDTAPDTA